MNGAPKKALAFRFDDIKPDFPMAKISRKRMIGEQMMLSDVTLEVGCDVPMHEHMNEQIAVVLSGRVRFTVKDPNDEVRTIIVEEGGFIHLPSQVPHGAYAEKTSRILDFFSPPSEGTGIDAPKGQ